MSFLIVAATVLATAVLGVLVDWLLKLWLPSKPKTAQRAAVLAAICVVVLVVAIFYTIDPSSIRYPMIPWLTGQSLAAHGHPTPGATDMAGTSTNASSLAAQLVPTAADRAVFSNAIAFLSFREGAWDIYAMNADGSGETRLTQHPGYMTDLVWSPDGKRVAFMAGADRNAEGEIYVMNADGSDPRSIKKRDDKIIFNSYLAWSPDGKMIGFYSDVLNTDLTDSVEIMRINADGSGLTRLATTTSMGEGGLSWSPDGRRIAFVGSGYHGSQIFVMNSDGSEQTDLHTPMATNPAWSPDGRRIAMACTTNLGSSWDICVMNADGSDVMDVANYVRSDSSPAWSPDGNKLAFVSYGGTNTQIYSVNVDGSGLTQLTNNSSENKNPVWLPLLGWRP